MGQKDITQKFNLYNVAGLIDKDKNIYFVPHKSALYQARLDSHSTVVQGAYHYLFNQVCPFSSDYHNVVISQWSPEDRSLVIEGVIDDFRQSRGRGLALNYMIVERHVWNTETETGYIHYYAFFIDSVEEVGINSVRLNVSPDYFTNFFYLSNIDTVTQTYDPFNSIMKNAYVERQHYNRGYFTSSSNPLFIPTNEDIFMNYKETFDYKYQYKDKRYPLLTNDFITQDSFNEIYDDLKEITSSANFISYLQNLTTSERKAVASLFVKYLHIKFKESVLSPIQVSNGTNYRAYYFNSSRVVRGINTPIIHMVRPVFDCPYELNQLLPHFWGIRFNVRGYPESTGSIPIQTILLDDGQGFASMKNGLGAYVLDYFVTKSCISLNDNIEDITIEDNHIYIDFDIDLYRSRPSSSDRTDSYKYKMFNDFNSIETATNYLGFLPSSIDLENYHKIDSEVNLETQVIKDNDTNKYKLKSAYTIGEQSRLGIVLTDKGALDIDLVFNNFDKQPYNILQDTYFDPILEIEPYTFTSLSLYENETVLKKSRYFQSYNGRLLYTINIKLVQSFGEAYKVGIIPFYELFEIKVPYYSESLVMTIPSSLPFTSDSYYDFYYVNKSQMKSQYAVNSVQGAFGIVETGVSGGADLIQQLTKSKSGYDALLKATGSIAGTSANLINTVLEVDKTEKTIDINQKARLSDLGAKPDTVKQAGSDMIYECMLFDLGFHINHYKIDEQSYNTIAKRLERYGYLTNRFDSIHIFDRVGLNYVKLISFDFVEDNVKLSVEEMNEVSRIFNEGVTLLHDKDYLHNLGETGYHNIELINVREN